MHTPTTPRRRLLLAGGLLIAVLVGVDVAVIYGNSSSTSSPFEPSTFTLNGSLTLNQSTSEYASTVIGYTEAGCQGTGPYSDLSASTAVTVANPEGAQVAVGTLTAGQMLNGGCAMTFTVPAVPLGLPSYSVTISHRGTQVETPEAAANGIALVIGGQ